MKRPNRNCCVKWNTLEASEWARKLGIKGSLKFFSDNTPFTFYNKDQDKFWGISEDTAKELPILELDTVQEFKDLFEEYIILNGSTPIWVLVV